MTVDEFWAAFLRDTGRDPKTKYNDSYHFCSTEQAANELLELVLSGKKRATTSALPCYEIEGEPAPKVGDLCVLTDYAGNPACVVETKAITIMPFGEMTFEICRREGEDDCLNSWRANHIAAISLDAA